MLRSAVRSMVWEVLAMVPRMSSRLRRIPLSESRLGRYLLGGFCPSKVGGMMRTGGMTKGLAGFIGWFGL